MNGLPSSEIVAAIYQLLPGFVTAWIFYGLTAHPRPTPFERVIQALIFTLFVEAIVQGIGICLIAMGHISWLGILGEWTVESAFVLKVITSIFMGFAFAACANTNRFHSILPDWITKRTSYPSEWFSAFTRTKRHVYLTFHDDRRIFGWPEEWPDEPGKGQFVVTEAEWILPDNTRVPLLAIERMVIQASDISLIEFEKELDVILENAKKIEATAEAMVQFNSSDEDEEQPNPKKDSSADGN
ncbi:MAG: DUF6338 family protein [Rubripirellula sp.]